MIAQNSLNKDSVCCLASNQIGKTYPCFSSLQPETAALVAGLKKVLDPQNLMNPGAQGFPESI